MTIRPRFSHDLENQMNMVEGMVTPGPHGPQALPGTYTLKLTVDGQVYTQTLVVHNDPRVGEGAAVMAALRAQNKLTLLAYQATKDTYSGNEEVAGSPRAGCRADARSVAARCRDAGHGARRQAGRLRRRRRWARPGRRRGRRIRRRRARRWTGRTGRRHRRSPSLNGTFNTMISMMQVGLDMAPTKAQIDTWESGCKNYNATVTAWKAMQAQDLAAFNALLTKNSLQPLTVTPTKLSVQGCAFVPSTGARAEMR